MDILAPEHPRHVLAFYVRSNVDFVTREAVADFVAEIGASRNWLLGPPEYFDVHELPEDDTHGDCCTDDVGAYIEIYSAWAPWTVPREIDLQQFEEATALLGALANFSREQELDFEVYFAGEVVGYVTKGEMDGVDEMLLDGWKQSLGIPNPRET